MDDVTDDATLYGLAGGLSLATGEAEGVLGSVGPPPPAPELLECERLRRKLRMLLVISRHAFPIEDMVTFTCPTCCLLLLLLLLVCNVKSANTRQHRVTTLLKTVAFCTYVGQETQTGYYLISNVSNNQKAPIASNF